ncbi:glycosyltransferase [Kosmotoga sp.]|uniref:glycosyltransferase n=1 Tax=Kosmotoga sp. TaxID=1955248 RepID=UPI00258DD20C|nr:glycosyltransferase [Kosmotoga sp.]MDK2953267.1 glucosylglycerate synthase [Kosmotoga sp.]
MFAVPDEIIETLEYFGKVEVVVGIPSYNNASTISFVTKMAAEGIEKYFGGCGVIVNADGNSSDGTREVFLDTETGKVKKLSFVYRGIPGKGSAMKSIMEISYKIQAPVTIFLDSDLRSVKPWWLERLGIPILEGKTSYITPYYVRHKYDGTITNNICYPVTSALYGIKIRQPIGGDFGVGLEMIEKYMAKPETVWETDVAKFGIDIWMTTIAINESEKKPMQAALGAKIHDVKDPGKHLGPMFSQVVGTLFTLMQTYEERWKSITKLETAEIYGDVPYVTPEPLEVDIENLKKKAIEGTKKVEGFVSEFLPEYLQKRFYSVSTEGTLDEENWVDFVYEFAKLYKNTQLRKQIIDAMIPLYFARVADFVYKTIDLDSRKAETLVEDLVQVFLKKKSELVDRW